MRQREIDETELRIWRGRIRFDLIFQQPYGWIEALIIQGQLSDVADEFGVTLIGFQESQIVV